MHCGWQDPKKAKRLQKLSSGPAFVAHRNTCVGRMAEKVGALQRAFVALKKKLEDAQKDVQDKITSAEKDSVLDTYASTLAGAIMVLTDWSMDIADSDMAGISVPDWQHGVQDGVATWCSLPLPRCVEEVQGAMRGHLRDPKMSVQLVLDVVKLRSKGYFSWMKRCLGECPSIFMVEAIMAEFKDDSSLVEQFFRNASKQASDSKSYLNQLKRRADQEQARQKKEADKKALADATALAKKEADKVKKGSKSKAVPDIFQVAAEKWAEITVRENIESPLTADDLDMPWVIHTSSAVATWKAISKVALKLSEFAASYKKAPTFKNEGRAQAPMQAKAGKEETEAMLSKIMAGSPLLDISAIPNGADFMSNVWHFGADSKMTGSFLAPNCAALCKILAMGEQTVIMFELRDLLKALGDTATCDSLTEFVLSLNVSSPQWASVRGFRTVLQADDILYVPQGWVMAEQCGSGILHHGVRKSFLISSERSKENYQCAISLLERSGRDPSKMKTVLGCYEAVKKEPEQ